MDPLSGASRDEHLNLVESARHLMELDPRAAVVADERWTFAAGRSAHPVISNGAYRVADGADPGELLDNARAFFGERDRGFSLWARGGLDEDRALIEAAESAGLRLVYEMPEMVIERRPEDRPLADGVELRRIESAEDAHDYWLVAADAYSSLQFPPEIFAFNERHEGLWEEGVAAFIARLDGRPAAIAMTIVSHGVAGIYWVGSSAEARGRGLGRAVTAAAVNAGLDMGAGLASLQASPMGEPLYRAMGFETIYDYRAYMHAPS
jgi:RimJ/RimL family protein N-acetyltransferase